MPQFGIGTACDICILAEVCRRLRGIYTLAEKARVHKPEGSILTSQRRNNL
jgi:hypothetical protein